MEKTAKSNFYVWPILGIIVPLVYKRYLLGYGMPMYYDIVADLFIFFTAVFLSMERTSVKWQRIQNIAAFLLVLFHWVDGCLVMSLNARLTLDNVVANYKYLDVIPYFITTKLMTYTALTFLPALLLCRKKITIPFTPPTTNLLSYEMIFVLFFVYVTMNNMKLGIGSVLKVGDYSLTARNVTKDTMAQVESHYPGLLENIDNYFNGVHWQNVAATGPRPNIIVVLSESLSGVDSKYSGGLFDRLPNIDKIQQDGTAMSFAVANGKITAHGLAASLLGIQTLKTGGYPSIPAQFPPDKFSGNDVIAYAKKAGYKTIVISAGQPRSWEGLSQWFEEVGFDKVYDKDSPEFDNAPHFTWDAPPDESMYQLAEKLIPQQQQPYLLMIETVSLHQPYILPDIKYKIGDTDLLNLINYVDQTTYDFYESLKQSGFFNDGVFVLFGDHRRFEPLSSEEQNNGGVPRWHERIIAAVVGKGVTPNNIYSTPFSLVDMNTLLHFIINGEKVDNTTLVQANLGSRLGVGIPFVTTLADEANGEYLVRSGKYPPAFISIFGKVPFSDIPYEPYKDVTVYLIKNDERTNKLLSQ